MFCEVIFFYNSETSYEKILQQINQYDESYQIITNRSGFEEFLLKQGKNVLMVDDAIPSIGKIGNEVFTRAKNNFELYEKAFKNFQCKNIEVFSGFEYKILMMNVLKIKLQMILEKQKNTIFIFEGFNPLFFLVLKKAKELGFSCNDHMKFIKNNDYRLINRENNFSVNQSKNYLKLSLVGKTSKERISIITNSAKKIISLGIKRTIQKYSLKTDEEFLKKILKQIDKKLDLKNLEYLFFVTAARDDLYLKPWFPILEKFSRENITYLTITSDLATSIILSKDNLPHISIFEEVKLLEEKIPAMKIGTDFRLFLEEIKKNNLLESFEELRQDIQKKSLRTIALIIILDHIFQKIRLKSIITAANGENLEDTAISVSKKFNVRSFSMLTVSISPPYPWFSKWHKSEKIFVYGLNGKNDLLSLGYNDEQIIITGSPKFEKLLMKNQLSAKILLEKNYKIDSKKKMIVIAMSKWHPNDEIWMSNLIKFCNKNDFEIIIKIHPKYKSASNEISKLKVSEIEKKCSEFKYLISYDVNLNELLLATDLVITEYSSVGIEAVLLGKKLLAVNFSGEKYQVNVLELALPKEAIQHIEDYSELTEIILESLLKNEVNSRDRIIEENIIQNHNYYNDGKASDRIFEILISNGNFK